VDDVNESDSIEKSGSKKPSGLLKEPSCLIKEPSGPLKDPVKDMSGLKPSKIDGGFKPETVKPEVTPFDRSEIVAARGTADGLILRLDGRVKEESLREALSDFLMTRKAFLAGNDVALEWVGAKPATQLVESLERDVLAPYDIKVRASRLREGRSQLAVERGTTDSSKGSDRSGKSSGLGGKSDEVLRADPLKYEPAKLDRLDPSKTDSSRNRTLSLFDGMEALNRREETEPSDDIGRSFYERASHDKVVEDRSRAANELSLWDDPDSRIIYSTLRSGQRVESEHSIVVFGDVNSGAEIISGGDIIVLGCLRGVAHAGAYDESGGGRVIFALKLQASQLRIGSVISRGEGSGRFEGSGRDAGLGLPELARVDGTSIVVEGYQPKALWGRR
jgi:septum formation inhibitor MinC